MVLKKELTYFDVTSIVVGSIVGADIYIASSLTAGMLGPLAILVWVCAGLCAVVIALVFAYCSYYVPRVGGPFAYVSEAFDDFYGFLAGWSIWIAEVLSLPVFAIAFVQYLQYFIALTLIEQIAIKAVFLFTLTFINIRGVKAAGRINDILTIVKLVPLLLLIIMGFFFFIIHPQTVSQNYIPLAPLGIGSFGAALVIIFWAYVGFEMGTIPASEMKNPRRTIPKAIITGMIIVMAFYLLTNLVVYGVINWKQLAVAQTPLISTGIVLFGSVGAVLMGIGALVSVSGSDESGILGTARLTYALSIDGLFPKLFAKEHSRYHTPYMALVALGIIAFVLSIFSGITQLISFAVFNLSFAFLLVCLSLIVLKKDKGKKLYGQHILPWIGIIICLYLLYSTSIYDKIIGIIIIGVGIPIYVFFSPKTDIHHLKKLFVSEEAIMVRRLEKRERFLAHFFQHLYEGYKKIRYRGTKH